MTVAATEPAVLMAAVAAASLALRGIFCMKETNKEEL